MSACFRFSYFSSCYFCLLLVTLFHLCSCDKNLCMDDERRALLEFKHGLIDGADRLASWVSVEKDCCNWHGIVCDNFTGHVQMIHLPGNCLTDDYTTIKEYEEAISQRLRGDISPSLLYLKQLKHLDLSCNDFGGIQIPSFMGSLENLRYLNLSRSRFGGSIPPQLGNLTELHVLCLGCFYDDHTGEYESTSIGNMQWLSSLRLLHHLDMSGVDLSKSFNWFQVLNTLTSLAELHLSYCELPNIHPHVSSFNFTSLSVLDLSRNCFKQSLVPRWIFSITGLLSLDLCFCGFHGPIPSSSNSFRNLTSLESLHIAGNDFMNSSLVLEGLSSIGGNLISLDISSCGVSSLVLESLHNLTSLHSIEMYGNLLSDKKSGSLCKFCNLRQIDLGGNNFLNISLTSIFESLFECQSPKLESLFLESSGLSCHLPDQLGQLMNLLHLQLGNNRIAGVMPDSIGRLSFLRYMDLDENLISGPIPYSIGGLSSLEMLDISYNQLNGSLPDSLGLLSKLNTLDLSSNMLTGAVTEAHFANLTALKYLNARGNNLTLRPRPLNWVPTFQLLSMDLRSWDLGPQFPSWLQLQRNLTGLGIRNTKILSTIPELFWRSLPNLQYVDMSQNQIQGRFLAIPANIVVLDLSSNKFSGHLPQLSKSSFAYILILSNNSFVGSLHHLLCPNDEKMLEVLDLGNNHLSGVVPECWMMFPNLTFINLKKNNLSGGIPISLGFLSSLKSLDMCDNKLSGRLPVSVKSLKSLEILQLAGNEFGGRIPAWLGIELPHLRVLNLRSNNFQGSITHELCHLTTIQILDLAHNNLSGNIPKCFNNFSVLCGKATHTTDDAFSFYSFENTDISASASLMIKGQEHEYNEILKLVMLLDLSSNSFSGSIPSELMELHSLLSLNLSRNQLTRRIPENIGDLKSLESFDVSLNQLSGELPSSLSSLSFLSSFNVSFNNLTGRIPSSTQLQSFNKSSFFGNKLCGDPLTENCAVEVPNVNSDQDNNERDWDLIISIMSGFIAGFWVVLVPLIVNTAWRNAYFCFLIDWWYVVCYL